MNYIDLVICKHEGCEHPFLYQAPAWSNLKKGDLVIVDTECGEEYAIVERSYTVDITNTSQFEFILLSAGVDVPLKKVLQKVVYEKL